MTGVMVVQGRELSAEDIGLIQGLMTEHRDWGRTRLSEELCHRWDWRNARGRIKDMAARTLLLKLERAGHIRLPKRRRKSTNGLRNRNAPLVAHATAPIRGALRQLRPLALSVVDSSSKDLRLFNCLLSRYHYLGHRNTVGENIRYLVRDRAGTAGGLRAVRLGGVEVRGARRMDRMGSRHAGGEPGVVDQQHALSGVALGRGAALGQPPARVSRSTYSRRLAEQVWTSDSCAGNFRGSQPLPGHLLQGGQLGEAGSNSGAHPQRPESLP